MSLEYAKHPTQRQAVGVGRIHDGRDLESTNKKNSLKSVEESEVFTHIVGKL